ncbi:MAG: ATP-binding cassette domain-containing protein [Rubrivivax sp.]
MNTTPFLRAQGLALAGRLAGVDLEWPRGSTVAILGPSGSGKTTLLRLLAGFEAPDAGSLDLDGQRVAEAGRVLLPPERRAIAFAFQEPALMPHLDALANVELGPPGAGRRSAAAAALADVGLPGFERRRIWQLSGGEAQRVQLARVIAADARLLLLDEPFASVDRMCRADLLQRIGPVLKARALEGGVALVTHDPADALELADTTVVMKAGRVVASGTFERLAAGEAGEWTARFLAAGLAGREIA